MLIPVDLSAAMEPVLARAALLPLARKARLTLLHVVPNLLSREARRRAESDAEQALELAVSRLVPRLPAGVRVVPRVTVGAPAAEIARLARLRKAELIVMGRGGGSTIRDLFLGSTAERVIRAGQLPVLVVRLRPHGAYQRPLLALDMDEAAPDVLPLALRVLPSPRPLAGLVHAYDVPYHGLIYPSLAPEQDQEHRHHYQHKALHDLTRLVATALAEEKAAPDEFSWKAHLHHGSPRTVIPKVVAKTRADLLVLGTRGHTGAAHVLLGTVAGDVLREVPCDVLVVPPAPGRRGHTAAAGE
ncbi:MAG TPA: universal stress protein [Myxococcaceae bacterium]